MQRVLLTLIAFLALTVPVAGLQFRYAKTAADITISTSAVSLFVAADVQAGSGHVQATSASCSLTGANIRVSWSGTAPTTTLGQVLTPGVYTITGTDVLLNMQGIRDDAVDAVWSCLLQGQ